MRIIKAWKLTGRKRQRDTLYCSVLLHKSNLQSVLLLAHVLSWWKEDSEFDRVLFQVFIKILPDLILQLCWRKDNIDPGFIIVLFVNGFSLSESEVVLDQTKAFAWIMTPHIYLLRLLHTTTDISHFLFSFFNGDTVCVFIIPDTYFSLMKNVFMG